MSYNNDMILSRNSMSNEEGLLVEIPISSLHSFADEQNIIKMTIQGWNDYLGIKPYFITLYNMETQTFDTGLENTDEVCLLCTKFNHTFGLVIRINVGTGVLYFYDAYYLLNSYEQYYNTEKILSPFSLRTIEGNINIQHINKNKNYKSILQIDEYTKAIIGVISDMDYEYNDYKNIVIDARDKRLLDLATTYGNLDYVHDLVGKYYYINENFIPIQNNVSLELNNVIIIRQHLSQIRQLEQSISNNILLQRMFNGEKLEDLQKEKQEKIVLIRQLKNEVFNLQQKIKEIKISQKKQEIEAFINQHQYKYNASLCLLIKDENEYLEEWLNHFYNLGIEHFYIYDNKSKTPIIDTIKSIQNGFYLDKCDVILFTEYNHMQYDCYADCLKRCEFETKWIGFMDTDEFLEFTDGTTNINEFLKAYETEMGVWIPWESYNANGLVEKPTGKVQDNFTNVVLDPLGLFGKIFVQTAKVKKMYVHKADSVDNLYLLLDQDGNDLKVSFDGLQKAYDKGMNIYSHAKIKHYFTRSYEEWCEKMNRGTCDPNFKRKFDVFFRYNRDLEHLKDKELLTTEQGYN